MSGPGWGPCGSDPIPPFDPGRDPRHERTYAELAPDRFIEQYRNKPIMTAILRAVMAQLQRLENACWEVALFRRISKAEGRTLDLLGAIVGRGRGELNDRNYRIAIRAQIKILRSAGRPEDIIAIAKLSTPHGTGLRFRETGPSAFIIDITTRVGFSLAPLWTGLRLARPVASRVSVISSSQARRGRWFRFAPSTTHVTDEALTFGFGSTIPDSNPGGRFRTVRATS